MTEQLKEVAAGYKTQYDLLSQNLQQADAEFQRQREQTVRTLLQLEGAIAAIQQLIENPLNTEQPLVGIVDNGPQKAD